MHRDSSFLLALLLCVSSFLFGDVKIKTRTTVMGHSSESTVYIKGARERTEMSFGGRGGMATILQCDQKRMITIVGDQCSAFSMGSSGETSCPSTPAVPSTAGMRDEMAEAASAPPRKGGVITITRTSTDTGERQEMFGYKARHIRSTVTMVASPDACNPSNMKMETDGWYADVSTAFSCADESVRSLACGGPMGRAAQAHCRDRIIIKGATGNSLPGYPLKQTMTMNSEHGNFTMSSEVVELTSTTLDAPLFDMPAGCQTTDMAAAMGSPEPSPASDTSKTPGPAANEAPTGQPTVAPAPAAVAPKTPGVARVGVVKLKDMTGQYLPTENLRINLMSEISARHMEAVPLEADAPQKEVEAEARAKECDYILYTVPTQIKEPGTGGLPAGSLPRGVKLDPAKFQALTAITVYKVGKPLPEIKDFHIAADGEQFGVNAVMATFEKEGDKLAQQMEQDARAHAAARSAAAKTAKPKPASKPH